MKRSFAEEEEEENNHNKKPKESKKEDKMSLLSYIHSLVQNVEQGNIDQCLSNSIESNSIYKELNEKDAELLKQLDLNLKKIAQRQLHLETENLRCRIMIQQQHQLFTSHDHEEKSIITSQTKEEGATPEDELTSIHDSSLLDKLESSYHHEPTTTTTSVATTAASSSNIPEGYFGNNHHNTLVHHSCILIF